MGRYLRFSIAATFVALLGAAGSLPAMVKAEGALGSGEGFQNNYPHAPKASFWAWQWERLLNGLPKPPAEGWKLPAVMTDPALLRSASANPSATWIGHATVPLGLKAWFTERGIEQADEYDWWQASEEGPLKITFVPVQHWSRRTLADTNETLWGGWVVEGEGTRVIHTGDTGYSQDFRDIGERFGGFDWAFIPIGAYAPRWFMQVMHVDVPEAVQVRADLRARRAIGIHWGTFEALTDEPADEPPAWLARQRVEKGLKVEEFDVMAIGETRSLR